MSEIDEPALEYGEIQISITKHQGHIVEIRKIIVRKNVLEKRVKRNNGP